MSGINFDEPMSEDNRTYTEKMFFKVENGNLVGKNIGRIDCSLGLPDSFPEDTICLLVNYKKDIVRGRKDPLKGKDLLAISSEKGPILIPFDEAVQFAHLVFSAATAAKRLLTPEPAE